VRILAEERLHHLHDLRDAGRAAHEDDLVDPADGDARVAHRHLARLQRPVEDVLDHLLELRPGKLQLQVLRPRRVRGDERKADLGLHHGGELDLGLLRPLLQALENGAVLRQVDPLVLPELGDDPLDQPLVDVVPAQVRVPVRRLHLDDVVPNLEDGDVEGAAAEVEDGDQLVLLPVEAVREGRRRGLVDDPEHVEAGDRPGVLGRLPLGVVEVGGDGDDRLLHLLAEVRLGRLLQLPEDHRGDLLRGVLLPSREDPGVLVSPLHDLVRHKTDLLAHLVVPAPHEPLDGEDGVLRIQHRLALRHLADQDLPVLAEPDHRRSETPSLLVDQHLRFAPLHHRHHGVRRPQIDPDDLRHLRCSFTI
jgi:hypothetical protein